MAKNRKEINREQERERISNNGRDRYYKRRNQAIAKLGGQCVYCGAINKLEFDHIDPATKDPSLEGK